MHLLKLVNSIYFSDEPMYLLYKNSFLFLVLHELITGFKYV